MAIMKLRRPKLKLIHSGLILVSVPLILGLVVVLTLNSALQHTMQLRRQAERSATALAAMSNLIADLLEARANRIEVRTLPEQASRASFDKKIERCRADLDSLKKLVAQSPQHYKILVPAFPSAERAISILTKPLSEQQIADVNGFEFETSIEYLRSLSERLVDSLPKESAKEYNRSLQWFIACILAINIAACPLLVLYYSQNVIRRLSILTHNSERFAQGRELLAPIEGDDEIAQVDSVFRSMVQTVTRARRQQQEMLQMISHDLRTPLTAIQGALTLIADGLYGQLSESGVQKARVAEESAGRLTNLVNELLDVERLESSNLPLELKPTSLQQVITRSIDSISGFATYKQITINCIHTDYFVFADEDRLIQVVVNLLSNAIKFSADGSAVSINVTERGHGEVEVRVTDCGRGVPPELKDSIFDRFSQIDRLDASNERGLGLGLAICKAIVLGHNGTIGVDSEHCKGSSFWFRLRLANETMIAQRVS